MNSCSLPLRESVELCEAVLKIAGMTNPPKQFFAGSDALAVIRPGLEARLLEIKDHEALSKSTDGTFWQTRFCIDMASRQLNDV